MGVENILLSYKNAVNGNCEDGDMKTKVQLWIVLATLSTGTTQLCRSGFPFKKVVLVQMKVTGLTGF